MPTADARRCACRSDDPCECVSLRYDLPYDPDERCECACHADREDDDDDR